MVDAARLIAALFGRALEGPAPISKASKPELLVPESLDPAKIVVSSDDSADDDLTGVYAIRFSDAAQKSGSRRSCLINDAVKPPDLSVGI